jgi:hypothetical protein
MGPRVGLQQRGEEKILDPTGTRTPTLRSPARSQSLYRLCYAGSSLKHRENFTSFLLFYTEDGGNESLLNVDAYTCTT